MSNADGGGGLDGFEAARREILEWVAEAVQTAPDDLDLDKPLADVGLDSLDAVHMIATIEGIIRQDIPEEVIRQVRTLNDVFEMMRKRMAAA